MRLGERIWGTGMRKRMRSKGADAGISILFWDLGRSNSPLLMVVFDTEEMIPKNLLVATLMASSTIARYTNI